MVRGMGWKRQPRWPKGTPTPRKGPGAGRWREDGKPDAPRLSWAEVAGRLFGRKHMGNIDVEARSDRSLEMRRIREQYGARDSEDVGDLIRQAATTGTRRKPGESTEDYRRRLDRAVADSPYWEGPHAEAARKRLQGPMETTDDVRADHLRHMRAGRIADEVAGVIRGLSDDAAVDRYLDDGLPDDDIDTLRRARTHLIQRGGLHDMSGAHALDRLIGRRGGYQITGNEESRLAELRRRVAGGADPYDELQSGHPLQLHALRRHLERTGDSDNDQDARLHEALLRAATRHEGGGRGDFAERISDRISQKNSPDSVGDIPSTELARARRDWDDQNYGMSAEEVAEDMGPQEAAAQVAASRAALPVSTGVVTPDGNHGIVVGYVADGSVEVWIGPRVGGHIEVYHRSELQ